jgi:hypothetical protein
MSSTSITLTLLDIKKHFAGIFLNRSQQFFLKLFHNVVQLHSVSFFNNVANIFK